MEFSYALDFFSGSPMPCFGKSGTHSGGAVGAVVLSSDKDGVGDTRLPEVASRGSDRFCTSRVNVLHVQCASPVPLPEDGGYNFECYYE